VAKLTAKEEKRARRLLKVIDEFRKLDPDMQMPMAASFLLVALNEGISRTDVMDRLGVAGSTATRNLMGLMEQGRLGRPGHGLVDQKVNPEERRWRMHYLTPKGRLVLRSMLALLDGVDDHGPDREESPPIKRGRRKSG
jgi:DNA-binding MarR family transcriptional regulator